MRSGDPGPPAYLEGCLELVIAGRAPRLAELRLGKVANVIAHFLARLQHLFHEPLHHREDAQKVETLDLVSLERVRALEALQRARDLFGKRAVSVGRGVDAATGESVVSVWS